MGPGRGKAFAGNPFNATLATTLLLIIIIVIIIMILIVITIIFLITIIIMTITIIIITAISSFPFGNSPRPSGAARSTAR